MNRSFYFLALWLTGRQTLRRTHRLTRVIAIIPRGTRLTTQEGWWMKKIFNYYGYEDIENKYTEGQIVPCLGASRGADMKGRNERSQGLAKKRSRKTNYHKVAIRVFEFGLYFLKCPLIRVDWVEDALVRVQILPDRLRRLFTTHEVGEAPCPAPSAVGRARYERCRELKTVAPTATDLQIRSVFLKHPEMYEVTAKITSMGACERAL
ncbi:hypothetical protein FB451DRAFT_1177647 [Mycena latifolia]|nr:hypothetical protein FB451DRAFT_1177647 [Mycena latifolia]